jgi:uncharacterized protein
MREKNASFPKNHQGVGAGSGVAPGLPSGAPGLNAKLLELLVCPLTKGPLTYVPSHQELISQRAGLAYPVREGVPILLVDEARPLSEAEKK